MSQPDNGSSNSPRLPNSPSSSGIPQHDNSSNHHSSFNSSGSQPVFPDVPGVFFPVSDTSFDFPIPLGGVWGVGSVGQTMVDVSFVTNISSSNVSFAIYDLSCQDMSSSFVPIPIQDTSFVIIDGSGYEIKYETGNTVDGSANRITFTTTDPSSNIQITENLTEVFQPYNDISGETAMLMNQLSLYASEIQCSSFHGKGTIDDYTELFKAASLIANESKQMELNIDVEGFEEFANAADDLSSLFNGFIAKLQNVNIITDVFFLRSIVSALSKIVNLSKVFAKFKEVVMVTTTVQIPKSTHDAAVILKGVMTEINCAVEHIQYFVSPTDISLNDAQLSKEERGIISKSVDTINSWNTLCENGITISMSNDVDIQSIQQMSSQLQQKTNTLMNSTAALRSKLASFHISC
jgi:hypothetical protein